MAGKLTVNEIILGDSSTPSQNFLLKTNQDGTATLARNADGSGGNILTVASDGKVEFSKGLPNVSASALPSMIRLNTANGYGSTNTKIRRFVNVVTNQGTDITYADSATLGASFTINTNGVYAISFNDQNNASTWIGISINSNQLTTDIFAINVADIIATAVTPGTNNGALVSATLYLPGGSVIRAHTTGIASGVNTSCCQFTITRVA